MASDLLTIPASAFTLPDFTATSSAPVITPPTVAAPSFSDAIKNLADNIAQAASAYYGTQAQIATSRAQAQIAAAAGQNAVQTARAGLPSPTLLLLGGAGLVVALALISRK